MAAGAEVMLGFGGFEDVGAGLERLHQSGDGALGDLAQESFQFRKRLADGRRDAVAATPRARLSGEHGKEEAWFFAHNHIGGPGTETQAAR
jgi:hypothetical protein